MTLRYLFFFALCAPLIASAQTFTDVTPGNIPALESGDIAWADYNNDGYLDFAIIGVSQNDSYSGIYTGSGTGTFELLANHNLPKMKSGDISWGDFDNDGDLDLAIIGGINVTPWASTIIMRNNITSFDQHFRTNGADGASLTWFDYDNDRDLDLYQVGAGSDNFNRNSVFINTDGQFSNEKVFNIKGYPEELTVQATSCIATDFDRDGDQDLFSSGEYYHGVWNEASLLVNNGIVDIENTAKYRFSYHDIATRHGSINQADFNKDGLMDYFLTGNNSSISSKDTPFSQLLFGTGDGNFSRRGSLLDVYLSSSDVGDVDNDGDLDIIVSGQSAQGPATKIFLNNGAGYFTDAGISNLVGLSMSSVSLADYDNDGDLDILMIGRDQAKTKTAKLYRNDLMTAVAAANEIPASPTNLRVIMEDNSVILEWDAGSDKETPTGSLTYNAYVAIDPKTPFKLFPQAFVETGKRKVYAQGNASVNKRLTLKNLKTGTYHFSVQTIDGANAGSAFDNELTFEFTRIDATGFTCPNGEQVFSVSPSENYTWTISGGEILSGQGTDMIRVKWGNVPVNARITATAHGSMGSIIPEVQPLPPATIVGEELFCDMNSWVEFHPATTSESLTYEWNIGGIVSNYAFPAIYWPSSGNKIVTLTTTEMVTGCQNSDTLHVIVSEPITVNIIEQNGFYTAETINASDTFKWEGYVNGNMTTVATTAKFRPTTPGYYYLTITNRYGCIYTNNIYVNEIVTGIEDPAEYLRVAPNPATTSFRIENLPLGKDGTISVIDMTGNTMLVTSVTGGTAEIDCSALNRGVYIVVTETGSSIRRSKIVLK
jgi:hypothetical protein